MEGAITLNGCLAYDNAFLDESIIFSSLPNEVNEKIRDYFYLQNYERPLIMTNVPQLKRMLNIACRTLEYKVTKLYELAMLEYNPLENYDRTEETTTATCNSADIYGTIATESTNDSTSTGTANGKTLSDNRAESEGQTVNENKVSAYDSTSYQNRDKSNNINTGSSNETSVSERNDTSENYTVGNDKTDTKSTTLTKGNEDRLVKSYIHGNIGVMSSQQMIMQSLDVLEKIDFYNFINRELIQRSQIFYYYFY